MSTPQPHHITIQKTARYFTLGELGEDTREVWFVIHGYAQLAADFIGEFGPLMNGSRFIVAPEGLNRFYARGFGGKPAATWMTSEDRQNEIKDYVAYLDDLYGLLDIPHSVKVVVLGFSQGVATASRFIHHSSNRVNRFIICSGEIASELSNPLSLKLKQVAVTYITGTEDPFITPEKHERVYALMQELEAKVLEFEGPHRLDIGSILLSG
jgi:predicted esterase